MAESNIPILTKSEPTNQALISTGLDSVVSLLTDIKTSQESVEEKLPTSPESSEGTPESTSAISKIGQSIISGIGVMSNKFGGYFDKASSTMFSTLLGPLNLVAQPLQDMLGFDLGSSLGGVIKGLFKKDKKSKVKPTASDVAKTGDAGSLFIVTQMKKIFGEGSGKGLEKMKKGLFGGLFKGLTSKLALFKNGIFASLAGFAKGILPKLIKGLPIAGLIVGVIMAVVDGIKGFKLSKIWGVSKISGIIGGVFGGADKGIKGMFKGAGKWGLIGAGAGSMVVPVVGTLVGGAIGIVIGGIMGFIGGERIAKWVQALGGIIKKLWNKMVGWIGEKITEVAPKVQAFLSNFFGKVLDLVPLKVKKLVGSLWSKLSEKLIPVVTNFLNPLVTNIINFGKVLWDNVLDFIKKPTIKKLKVFGKSIVTTFKKVIPLMISEVKAFSLSIGKSVVLYFGKIVEGVTSWGLKAGEIAVVLWNGVTEFFNSVVNKVSEFGTHTIEIVQGLWNSVTGFFFNLKSSILSLTERVGEIVQGLWNSVTGFFFNLKGSILGLEEKVGDIATVLWGSVTGFFLNIFSTISNIDISGIAQGLIDGVYSFIGKITNWFNFIGSFFKDGVGKGIIALGKYASGMITKKGRAKNESQYEAYLAGEGDVALSTPKLPSSREGSQSSSPYNPGGSDSESSNFNLLEKMTAVMENLTVATHEMANKEMVATTLPTGINLNNHRSVRR